MADAANPKKNTVDVCAEWISEDEMRHDLASALREGVPAMRRKAQQYQYMRPNPGEMEIVEIGGPTGVSTSGQTRISGRGSFTLYQLRIDRSDLPNPWADSIRSTARLPFRSRIVLSGWDDELQGVSVTDDKDVEIERTPGWVDSMNSEGQGLDEYMAEQFEDKLFRGIVYTFVDNDPRTFDSVADRRKAGARPRVTKLLRRNFRRVTLEERNGELRLKQIVFEQPLRTLDISDPNAWIDETKIALKVVTAGDPDATVKSLRQVTTRLYVPNDKSEYIEDTSKRGAIVPDNPTDELVDIPLVPHYAIRTGPYRGDSPYLNSAWTQNVIWNHNSEMGNLAREASLMFVHESGVLVSEKTGLPLRQDTRNARYRWSSLEGATLTIGEVQGTALASIAAFIEAKTNQVERAHHQIRTEKPAGPVTAREITLEGVQASSALEMWVLFEEKAWTKILTLMALLGGLPKRGTATIPHDFGLPSSGVERNHQLYLGGMMSPKNYWNEARRAGDVDERGFDYAYEVSWANKKESAATESMKITPNPKGDSGAISTSEKAFDPSVTGT